MTYTDRTLPFHNIRFRFSVTFCFGRPFIKRSKRGGATQNSTHVYCGQTAAWIKMPLGTEVGLGLRDIVLDGEPTPPPLKRHRPPIFGQCPLWPNGWMDEDATWYGSRPRPRQHCIRRRSSSQRKGHSTRPSLRPMSNCGHGRPSQLLLGSC